MKRTALIISALSLIIISTDAFAAKLVEIKAIDKDYLMVQFKDGDINFVDDGLGSTAFTGNHDTANNYKVTHGTALNTTNAVAAANWVIKSTSDANFGTTGLHPANCYRKSKLNGMAEMDWSGSDYIYDYTMEHTIYLQLPHSLVQANSYTIDINANTNSNVLSRTLNFDIFNSPSEAVHVNLVGYLNDSSIKAVDLYMWMGNGGARNYSAFVGNKVYIYNVNTSATQEVGNTVAFWKSSGSDVGWYNLTMSDVWKADFNDFNTPGTYRIAIEGIGCSENFEIKKDVYYEPFRVSTLGYFYMRIGQETNYPGMPVPRRPLYIPNVSPSTTKVYITTMSPIHPSWGTFSSGDVWDKPTDWAPYKKTGNPQNNNAYGGHSDAADWDRHLGHISNIYDMLLPYILTDGKLNDDNLQIAESGNGIPDILDEARNEVDFWLRLRDGDGYSHGVTNPDGSNNLYQAGITPIAAWANAANASMLANCFMLAGLDSLKDTYTTAAITAYNYASGLADQMLSATQNVGDLTVRGKDLKMMAAAFLYNLTGDTAYENMVNSLSEVTSDTSVIVDSGKDQLWACAGYLKTKRTVNYPTLFSRMKASIINEAKNVETNNINNRPSRRATDNAAGYWKLAHNVQRSIVAHSVATNPADIELFKNAIIWEADWGLGRNSLNIIYMTTAATNLASKRSVENAYTTGRDDGTPGVHPGHTPYINTDDWYTGMIMGKPSWMTDKCYPAYGTSSTGWPKAEGYFNTRYVWAHSEFTPQQTMRGKMALYGYLYGLYNLTDLTADFDGLVVFCDSWLKVPGDAGYDSRANLYDDPSGIVNFYDFVVFANKWSPNDANGNTVWFNNWHATHKEVASEGDLFEGFENLNDWTIGGTGCTKELSIAAKEGIYSLQLNSAGLASPYATKTISLNLSSATNFVWWAYLSDSTSLSSPCITLSSTTNLSKEFVLTFTTFKTGWNKFVFSKSDFTNIGGEDWANTMVRLGVSGIQGNSQSNYIRFDDLRMNYAAKPKVIITFDDGYQNTYDNAFPIMAANRQKGVSFVVTDWIGTGDKMSMATLIQLYNYGWDISNHTKAHAVLTGLSEPDMHTAIDTAETVLAAFSSKKFIAFPGGYFNQTIIDYITSKDYVFGRSTVNSLYQPQLELSDQIQYQVKAKNIYLATTPAAVEGYIDRAINQGGLLVLLFHQIVNSGADVEGEWLTSNFQIISDYLKVKSDAGLLDVETFTQYYNGYWY